MVEERDREVNGAATWVDWLLFGAALLGLLAVCVAWTSNIPLRPGQSLSSSGWAENRADGASR